MSLKITPVIHALDFTQVARNIDRAVEAGCNGVFLINHGISGMELGEILREVCRKYPTLWVGANFLDLSDRELVPLVEGWAAGLWLDGVPSHDLIELTEIEVTIFAGVAFKHQPERGTLAEEVAAMEALDMADVLVTSGPATGVAPSIQKIQELRGLTDLPIGIASGMTPENVGMFAPYLDWILVATGVSSSFTELDPELLDRFVGAVSESFRTIRLH